MLATVLTILFQGQLFFQSFFIAMRVVIDFFTLTALQFDQIFLWHTDGNIMRIRR